MPLPAVTESLDAVPEAARAFYIETGEGGFRLDAEGVEDVSGLKSALEKERAARKELKAELENRGEAGPDTARERLETALIAAEARAAIHAEHGIAELLLPVVMPRLMLNESESGYMVAVRGDNGEPVRDAEDLSLLTPRAFVQSLQSSKTYGRAFEVPAKGGSGAPSLGQAGAPETVIALSDQNALDRNIAAIASGRVRVAR
ncbi:hypothetical protein NUH88_08870 [Nisaea acidiphila]|uniref:Uncharacterized protein n=1 Tax=Nisaea acidiphila TaxID=1862145 RepID=A0A9J7AWR0_9PROT|nr:hypothetical protein [Nisaea acidiphila]UUX51799.1 hypothetical protein NUH88_08870 [Nisaea acidiphila]